MGVTERKEREKQERRKAIIDAAEKVFFSRGVENATMDEVAEIAELSKGTLYLYFKNKSDLLHAIMARALELLYTMFEKAARKQKLGMDKIRVIGEAYYEFFKTKPDYYTILLHEEKNPLSPQELEKNLAMSQCHDTGTKILELMEKAAQTGMKDGSIRKDLDVKLLPIILWGHSAGILHLMKIKGGLLVQQYNRGLEEIVAFSFSLMRDYLDPHCETKIPPSKKHHLQKKKPPTSEVIK